jgi:D-hydroxyproline dehydrogenase subunit beta
MDDREQPTGNVRGPACGRCGVSGKERVAARRSRRLVTEPLPATVRHKVYSAEYVGDVASSDEALQSSPVVEGTPAGTILIGATRERVGFDRAFSPEAAARLARGALTLFPVLAGVQVMRSYLGFRPYALTIC